MPKRPPTSPTQPIDIFASPRLEDAMARATAPIEARPSIDTREREGEGSVASAPQTTSKVVSMPGVAYEEPPPRRPQASETRRQKRNGTPTRAESQPPESSEPEAIPTVEQNVPMKFRIPQTLRAEFQTFKAELSGALQVTLDDSNVARPYLELLLTDLRDRVLEVAGGYRGRLRRPANGDAVAMAEFDHVLGEIFREARGRKRPGSREST